MPKVSIIMPVYNAELYLSKALESVIGQSFTDLEVVCIDDGSTDASLHTLLDYKSRDKRVKVITQKNKGGSAARNMGLKHATGEYIMFLDSDDIYAKNIIYNAHSRAVETGADIVLYNFARFVGKPTFMAVTSGITPGRDIKLFTKDNYNEYFFNNFATITWNKLIKRSVITNNSLNFDTGLSHNHDVDFSIRLMLAANTYSWIDEVGYYYRDNDSGITATKRSDPTNVLRILINLNKLVIAQEPILKKSFDNYAADMIAGTLNKYSNDSSKQREVFNFSRTTAIPSLGLSKVEPDYIYNSTTREILGFVKSDDYEGFKVYASAMKRRFKAVVRKIYDAIQRIISVFIVQ